MEYAWQSCRYVDFEHLLDSFVHRSQDISLANALEADIWVLEGEAHVPGGHVEYFRQCGNHAALEALRKAHKTAPWSDVPWGDYDIVLGSEPIVPDSIIREHPQILWCYKSLGHCWPAHQRWARKPDGAYDLFLNHHTGSAWHYKLPASIYFPHLVHIETMRSLVAGRRPAVFLDHWMVTRPGHGCSQQYYDDVMASYRALTGLEVVHAQYGSRTKHHVDVAEGRILHTRDYLRVLGGCKYFTAIREGSAIGQAVIEAAALGCIVISNSACQCAQRVCHSACLTPTTRSQGDKEYGMRQIRKIEADSALQEEILAHQDAQLRRFFWTEPMLTLLKAVEVKRGHS